VFSDLQRHVRLGPHLQHLPLQTVSLAYGGESLGTCWGKQKALELLAEGGFTEVNVETIQGVVEAT
jgi:hypothetical protein